ncbi:hypothetical protein I4641_01225 [Waterburya agarophytonicola K14]|uniref:Uncharacterized protein n=1 Tax=Waterburya agarophytonicola KI4 TaxID=2874699 RepID=A0A964FE89_9CYAN|nr:hypothetical protein [Waterburya agarophytonicola]MCC0175602.1 hypothetical protein [Waterburya agarophytonicola KI4]
MSFYSQQVNRNIKDIVEHKFDNVTVEQFYALKLFKVIGYILSMNCH